MRPSCRRTLFLERYLLGALVQHFDRMLVHRLSPLDGEKLPSHKVRIYSLAVKIGHHLKTAQNSNDNGWGFMPTDAFVFPFLKSISRRDLKLFCLLERCTQLTISCALMLVCHSWNRSCSGDMRQTPFKIEHLALKKNGHHIAQLFGIHRWPSITA